MTANSRELREQHCRARGHTNFKSEAAGKARLARPVCGNTEWVDENLTPVIFEGVINAHEKGYEDAVPTIDLNKEFVLN
jgi:hypothetical protein